MRFELYKSQFLIIIKLNNFVLFKIPFIQKMQIQLKTAQSINNKPNEQILDHDGSEDGLTSVQQPQQKINVTDLQNGPHQQSRRQCKDVFCFVFYWLNTLAMIILSAWAYFAGTPSDIYRATDSSGNICGKRGSAAQKYRYVYFFNPTTNDLSNRVCVQNCLQYSNGALGPFSCFPDGPSCKVNITISPSGQPNQTVITNGKYFLGYQSFQRIDRICLPSDAALKNVLRPYSEAMADNLIQSKLLDFISDVQNNYGWLFAMGAVAILSSILYWIGLKYLPVVSIWVSLLMTIALFIIIGFVFLYNGGALTVNDQQGRLGIPTSKNRAFYTIYGAFCMAFTIISIIVFIYCFHQTGPTIQMIRIASHFFKQLPTSLIIVLMMTCMMYLFWMTAISSMIYALSASDYSATGKVFTSVTGQSDRGLIIFYYFIFNAFWTHQIFISNMVFGVSSVAAKWYYHTGPVEEMERPMWRTLMMIMRFMFGSLVFGSLVLLAVQILQFLIQIIFFIHSWKFSNSNSCFKCIDRSLQCAAKYMSVVTSRMNRFAYVLIAFRSKNYMDSSKDGYLLLKVNPHRYGFLFTVNSILFFMIRIGIALIPTTIFYLCCSFWQFAETSILQPIYFVLLIFYFSLGMSSVIIGSYSACIDSLMTCYVADQLNQKDKAPNLPLYAPKQMAELFMFIR